MSDKNKHITYEDRLIIQQSLRNHESFKDIAKRIGKDCTSVSREIRRHLVTTYTGNMGNALIDCGKRNRCPARSICGDRSCTRGNCVNCKPHCSPEGCGFYEKEICPALQKPPYVCTGCSKRNRCRLPKTDYYAKDADREYRTQLKELRQGVTISEERALEVARIFSEGTSRGQSVHHIIASNGGEEAFGYSERTMYNYISGGILPGIKNIDLPRKVSYSKRKKSPDQFIKVDKACRIGRLYEDYLSFIKQDENRYKHTVQMDTVEGRKGSGEKAVLTVFFGNCCMMFGHLRDANTSASVAAYFNRLKAELGEALFSRLFPIILTDRGTEFSDPAAIEMSLDGKRQLTHVFYCDPMHSNQKPEIERCHSDFRRIVPKGTSLNGYSQDDINTAFGNVAAIPRPQFYDRTSAELFIAIYGEEIFRKLGGVFVEPKDANLTPRLLRK